MEPASKQLEVALASMEIQAPACPVVSNVTGKLHEGADSIRTLLAEQLSNPVRWEADVRTLLESGVELFLELGSGAVLKGLMRKIDREAQVLSVGTPEECVQAAQTLAGVEAATS